MRTLQVAAMDSVAPTGGPPTPLDLLASALLRSDGLLRVVKMQPPDGCVAVDAAGNRYGVSIYSLPDPA